MRKVIDIQLTPDVVNFIKQTPDNQGIILYDCDWFMEATANMDRIEEGYTISGYKKCALTMEKKNENNGGIEND